MKILIIVLIVVVLLVGGGLGFILMKGDSAPAEGAEGAAGTEGGAEEAPEMMKDALYVSLNPAFLVTFKHGTGLRYLQTEMEVMSYEKEVIEEIENNRPAVRNNILMHLSSQDYDVLETVEGRQELRETVKVAIQDSLRTTMAVEAVYFNTFVIQ